MKKECKKIQRLCPERYLLVTFRFLTPAEKDRLLAVLSPFCKSAEDILEGYELNALLRRHPEVEQTHYIALADQFGRPGEDSPQRDIPAERNAAL